MNMKGFFDFMLTPSKRCEKEIFKLLDDVAKTARQTTSNLNEKEDQPLILAVVLSAIDPAIKTLKENKNFQAKYNLSDSEYDNIVSKVSYKINRKYIPNWDNMIADATRRKKELRKLREKIGKEFDKSVAIANRQAEGDMLAGLFCFHAISQTYASMKKDVSIRKLYNLSDAEYDEILDEVLHQKGRLYISNWDDMVRSEDVGCVDEIGDEYLGFDDFMDFE